MRLTTCLARSYRPFNYDFKRKLNTQEASFPACKDPWDQETDYESWRPMVTAPIQPPISCVVGLNESGKSLLIDAIWKVMTNSPFEPDDVCRYSRECRLENMGNPVVGVIWEDVSNAVIAEIEAISPKGESTGPTDAPTRLVILKDDPDSVRLMTLSVSNAILRDVRLPTNDFARLLTHFPRLVRINTRTFLPAVVPIKSMLKIALAKLDDTQIEKFLGACKDRKPFNNHHEVKQHAVDDSQKLAYRLLERCAAVEHTSLQRIRTTSDQLRKEFSAQATSMAEELLNLGHWWGQDVDAKLSVDLQRDDVLLNVTDRTGSWYGFSERSQGMRYFLGYLVQIALEFKEDTRPLLILTDEPDFALSSVAQRDLLRFFKHIVTLDREGQTSQIVFSTHSPELIDPNYPDRITVLRKGTFDEGTTVMNRAHHRLFEPVRSALGARVSSLPFIDGPNLVVEGLSDRTFILRMSQYLAKRDQQHLDLSGLSIVVAEGSHRIAGITATAMSIPGDRAYITILLDNDEPGRRAAKEACALDTTLLERKQVVRIDDILGPGLGKDSEIEDLIPVRLYYQAFLDVMEQETPAKARTEYPDEEAIATKSLTRPIVDIVTDLLPRPQGAATRLSYDKEAVIDRVFDNIGNAKQATLQSEFDESMRKATELLLEKVRENLRNKRHDEISRTMRLLIREFLQLNPLGSAKTRMADLLEQVRELGNRVSAVGVFDKEIDALHQDFALRQGLRSEAVKDYPALVTRLKQLPQRLVINPDLALM